LFGFGGVISGGFMRGRGCRRDLW